MPGIAIKRKYKCKATSRDKPDYLGMQLERRLDSAVVVDSEGLERKTRPVEMASERKRQENDIPTEKEGSTLRKKLSNLSWLGNSFRPDLPFANATAAGIIIGKFG